MTTKHYDRKLLDFLLKEVIKINELFAYEYFNEHSIETANLTLDIAEGIAEKHMASAFVDSDRKEPKLESGIVKVHPKVKDFVKENAESGLISATFPFENHGQQLPKTVYAGAHYIQTSTHNAFVMYTDLMHGCSEMILRFGSDKLKEIFYPKLISGEWMGSMCLTEPQAGSSLSDINTTAYPQADGTYKLVGQKIFISAGDQDVSRNIVHLVLARIEGAPRGTKGISLFVVPKIKIDENSGTLLSENNDVKSIGIFHKMGQKATPAMHLGFGENNNCTAYLLGEENRGLPQMFKMMNGARLGVGMTGVAIASAAYQLSLQYAKERTQGRIDKSAIEQIAIIQHPDVKRMLLFQKAIVEGGLCLLLRCYKYLDLIKVSNEPKYAELAELLTPVAKTFGAEMGIQSTNQGLQVLGGYGYTEDFMLEQLARDVRICSIYEGTTGIHSLAILGREVLKNDGESLVLWKNEIDETLNKAKQNPELSFYCQKLENSINKFLDTTLQLKKFASEGLIETYLSDATIYMELFGILNIAWQWLAIALNAVDDEKGDHFSKLNTMKFYFKYELEKTEYLNSVLLNSEKLTIS
ncbi:acyl-CoA dehydrogenase [Lacihabitans sp. LS3-19]|uniref:acyl-CoA dehydrogenase n=1 Tax=Lacihabitans sp. LS3-19 TaxID=2487335 RepID=UPI0020CF2B73|nr:acyl-CoA dehydrogenase [Lacihabitans sp. LS3-19]MCP9770403.1 acyl-CoA dehydrogenase [Lacihabitans sp. LS3-19]